MDRHQADPAREARQKMWRGDYAASIATVSAALAAEPEAPRAYRWALERLRLEARARAGDGAAALRTLGRLRREFPEPDRVDALLYLGVARWLADAGDESGAHAVASAGRTRFPEAAWRFTDFPAPAPPSPNAS